MAIEISISASRSWDKEYLLELGENRPELLLFYGHKVTKTVTETCLSQWYPCKFEADGLSRCSHYPEEEIDELLKSGIKKEEDVVHILAWKIGKIAHLNCEKNKPFSYSSDWADLEDYDGWARNCSTVKLRKIEFPIKEIAEYVLAHLNRWEKEIEEDNWFAVLEDFNDTKMRKGWKGLGTVYCITLLYFISKGKYPIFDQFADKALDVISNNKEEFPNADHKMYEPLPSELPTKGEKLGEFKERYHEYCEKIEKLKSQLPEVYRNPRNRGLDRALWVYGHIKCAGDIRK